MRHFDDSRHSFAKIAIPYTIYLSLNLPEFYVWQSISLSMVDAPAYDFGHSFAKIAIPYTILSLAQFTFFLYLPASSCGLASWMRPQMIPDTHSLKLLFPTRYTSCSIRILLINQHSPADLLLGFTLLQYTIATHILPFLSIKFKNPYTVDEYSQKLNERKILTVLRRNSIIIVNCSAEYI